MLNFGSSQFEKHKKIQAIKILLENGYTLEKIEEEQLFDSRNLFVYLTANSDKFKNMCFTRRTSR